jgi:hypothetical protein
VSNQPCELQSLHEGVCVEGVSNIDTIDTSTFVTLHAVDMFVQEAIVSYLHDRGSNQEQHTRHPSRREDD